MNYKKGQKIEVMLSRTEANFDRACDEAYIRAVHMFGCDNDGHLRLVIDNERSTDSIMVQFESYNVRGGMGGITHTYLFKAWVA